MEMWEYLLLIVLTVKQCVTVMGVNCTNCQTIRFPEFPAFPVMPEIPVIKQFKCANKSVLQLNAEVLELNRYVEKVNQIISDNRADVKEKETDTTTIRENMVVMQSTLDRSETVTEKSDHTIRVENLTTASESATPYIILAVCIVLGVIVTVAIICVCKKRRAQQKKAQENAAGIIPNPSAQYPGENAHNNKVDLSDDKATVFAISGTLRRNNFQDDCIPEYLRAQYQDSASLGQGAHISPGRHYQRLVSDNSVSSDSGVECNPQYGQTHADIHGAKGYPNYQAIPDRHYTRRWMSARSTPDASGLSYNLDGTRPTFSNANGPMFNKNQESVQVLPHEDKVVYSSPLRSGVTSDRFESYSPVPVSKRYNESRRSASDSPVHGYDSGIETNELSTLPHSRSEHTGIKQKYFDTSLTFENPYVNESKYKDLKGRTLPARVRQRPSDRSIMPSNYGSSTLDRMRIPRPHLTNKPYCDDIIDMNKNNNNYNTFSNRPRSRSSNEVKGYLVQGHPIVNAKPDWSQVVKEFTNSGDGQSTLKRSGKPTNNHQDNKEFDQWDVRNRSESYPVDFHTGTLTGKSNKASSKHKIPNGDLPIHMFGPGYRPSYSSSSPESAFEQYSDGDTEKYSLSENEELVDGSEVGDIPHEYGETATAF